ncbi:MAG: hypothetical protein ACNA7O_04960 [Rhodobacterales bacterium]
MRTKVKEVDCRDQAGNAAIIIEWMMQAEGMKCKNACSTAFSLEDGSPVNPLGGKFEHFYNGMIFTPV